LYESYLIALFVHARKLGVRDWEVRQLGFADLLPDSQQDLSVRPILRKDNSKQNSD
jgi:hypothetical protein